MEAVGVFELAFCAMVVTAAFMVRGTTGFGSAAIAIPLAALVFPAQTVIPVVAHLQLVSTVDHSARNWRAVAWSELLRMAPCMVAGVLLGLYLFSYLDPRTLNKGLGVAIIAYAVYSMANARRDCAPARRLPWPVSVLLNTGGAAIGAIFGGVAAPFYAAYLSALRLSTEAFRATMTAILLVQVVMRITGYVNMGFVDTYVLLVTAGALPFMFFGARLGDAIAGRVDAVTFNRIIGVVLLLSGLVLIWK